MDTSLKAALGRLRRVYAGESVVAVYWSQTVGTPYPLIPVIAGWWRTQDEKAVVRAALAMDEAGLPVGHPAH